MVESKAKEAEKTLKDVFLCLELKETVPGLQDHQAKDCYAGDGGGGRVYFRGLKRSRVVLRIQKSVLLSSLHIPLDAFSKFSLTFGFMTIDYIFGHSTYET